MAEQCMQLIVLPALVQCAVTVECRRSMLIAPALPCPPAVLLQVLADNRIKHYFAGTDMKKQVGCRHGHTVNAERA